jgi:hypothetical protein
MDLVRELAGKGQEQNLREIAEEMRRAFPSIWSSGVALKALGVQSGALSWSVARAIGVHLDSQKSRQLAH